MSVIKIVPGGERVGKAPSAHLRFRTPEIGPRSVIRSVIRRFGRRPAELFHAVDWTYVRFAVAYGATVAVVVHIALGRGL